MNQRNFSEISAKLILGLRPFSEELDSWQTINVAERVLALVIFVAFLPALLTSAVIVWLLSGRAPFIAHKRVGLGGADIWVFKLRTMWGPRTIENIHYVLVEKVCDVENQRPAIKTCRDPRVTSSFAAFLRRHSIDELPQLGQVACGRLALVGPRPITRREIHEYYGPAGSILLLENRDLPAFGRSVAVAGSITRSVAGSISSCSKSGLCRCTC